MDTISPQDMMVARAHHHGTADGLRPAQARIVCVGQITADSYLFLDRPLLLGDQVTAQATSTIGGTAAIIAHNAAVAGGHVSFVGHVGSDEAGRLGAARLRAAGVAVEFTIATPESRQVTILVHPDGQRTMVATTPIPVWSELDFGTTGKDIVCFEGWHLLDHVTRPTYAEMIRSVARTGAFVALDVCSARAGSDTSFADLLVTLGASLVLANEAEALAYGLIGRPPAPIVIAHAGPEPTTVVESGTVSYVPVPSAPVVDTTGAGDTFAAGLLVALSKGASAVDAVTHGHRLAQQVIAIRGALLPLARLSSHV